MYSNYSDKDFMPDEVDASTNKSDYSEIETEDDADQLEIGVSTYLSDIFSYRKPTDPKAFDYDNDFHLDLELNELKDVEKCFEILMESYILLSLCSWTNERAHMYFEDKCMVKRFVHGLKWEGVCTDKM